MFDVPAADHGKAGSTVEDRRCAAASLMVCLPALIRSASSSPAIGERADAEHAVLGLERHVHAVRNVVGHQRRDADAEVDVDIRRAVPWRRGRPSGRVSQGITSASRLRAVVTCSICLS